MKKSLLFFFVFLSFSLLAQESQIGIESSKGKNNGVTTTSSITIEAKDANTLTLLVINPAFQNKLTHEKIDELSALPGIKNIAVNWTDNNTKVCIENNKVNAYLVKYFGFTEVNVMKIIK